MGCDIHAYIEFPSTWKKDEYEFFAEVDLPRNYEMFEVMAGVRGYNPIFEPKGLPDDISWRVDFANTFSVTDELAADGHDRQVTREVAERWVQSGSSKWINENKLTHPDWHSHSWLDPDEYTQCLRAVKDKGIEYKTVAKILRAIPGSRLVFWFDN